MIDFSNSPDQKTGGAGPIPAKSMVKVKMEIRKPKAEKATTDHPLVTVFKSGLVGLDCEFEVISGQFEGTRIWENIFFRPDFQSIQMSKGQIGICNSSDAKFRAIIEASRGISPTDGSPAAVQARSIQDWNDFNGLEFPVLVGVAKPETGDKFINNTISRVITPERDEYPSLMMGEDIITDIPLPELPQVGSTAGTSANNPTGGYTPPNQQRGGYTPPGQQQTEGGYSPPDQTQSGGNTGAPPPSWAQ